MQLDVAALLKGLLDSMGAEYKDISEIELAGQSILMISAEDGKKLIGSHGDTIHATHINEPQEEITAIEQDLIAGLPLARGGTGATSFTANGVLVGNGTGALQVTAAGTAGHILTANSAAAPSFQSIATETNIIAMQVFS